MAQFPGLVPGLAQQRAGLLAGAVHHLAALAAQVPGFLACLLHHLPGLAAQGIHLLPRAVQQFSGLMAQGLGAGGRGGGLSGRGQQAVLVGLPPGRALGFFLAQDAAQHLADEALGQFLAEFEELWHLVVGKTRAAMGRQLGRGQLFARPRHHIGLEHLAAGGMFDAHGHGFGHLGVFVQDFVHLAGIDVVPAHDDQILLAVHDIVVAVLVVVGDVAGMQPAVAQGGGGLLGAVPVALHDLRPAHQHLAFLTRAQHATAVVDVHDAHFRMREGHADGAFLLRAVQGIGRDAGRGFGEAETFGDAGVRQADPAAHGFGGEGRGAGDADLDTGEVVFFDVLLLHERHVDRRRTHEEGGPEAGDGAQEVGGRVARHRDGGGGQGRGQDDVAHQAENVEEGHDAQEGHGLAVFPVHVEDGQQLLHLGRDAGMAQHGALGPARGAARVLEQGQGVAGVRVGGHAEAAADADEILPAQDRLPVGHLRHLPLAAGLDAVEPVEREGQAVGDARDHDQAQGQAFAQGLQLGPEQVQGHQHFRPGVVEVVQQFLLHIERIGHDGHGPGLHDAPEGDDGLRDVGQHDGHPLARPDPAQAQGLGEVFRRLMQAAVGHLEILETDGQTLAVGPGGPVQQQGQMHGPDDAFHVFMARKMPPPAGALCVRLQAVFPAAVPVGTGGSRLQRGSHALLRCMLHTLGVPRTAHALPSPGPETGGLPRMRAALPPRIEKPPRDLRPGRSGRRCCSPRCRPAPARRAPRPCR